MRKGSPGIPDSTSLCRKAEIKLSCSHFSHRSFVTLEKSFEPGSAHIPAGNGTEAPGGKVKLEGRTFHHLSRFNSFYRPGCLSGHLMPNFTPIFPLTSRWLPPQRSPPQGSPPRPAALPASTTSRAGGLCTSQSTLPLPLPLLLCPRRYHS